MPETVAADITEETRRKIREALADAPSAMTLQLARRLGVPEAEVIRAMPAERVAELDLTRRQELLESLETLGKVHVIVSNAATTCETVGEFGGFSVWGEFFNVQSKTLDMHIRPEQLGAAFAVEKPSHMDGISTLSIQFYDRQGAAAFKVFLTFGGSAPSPEKTALFQAYRGRFRR